MKMEVCGGLGGSIWHLGGILEPRWRPRSPRGAPRGAKTANMAPRWANMAPRWGPKSAPKSWKFDWKNDVFFDCFFDWILERFGSKNQWKIDSKIEENMIANAVGENYENVHSAHAKITFLMFRQLPNPSKIEEQMVSKTWFFRSWFWSRFFMDLGWILEAKWDPKSMKKL